MKESLWRWEWNEGGWNQCYAFSRREALTIAKKKGARILTVKENTLRIIRKKEMEMACHKT